MPVKKHCEMISKQFLLATQKPEHPNKTDLSAPPPPRQMKRTLRSCFGDQIKRISNPNLSDEQYKSKLKLIHTRSVQTVINSLDNKVLNTKPPDISKTEKSLPRTTRSTLAQLRSGYSIYLNSYKARIDRSVVDKCPDCDNSHTTTHIFNCPNKPTDLTVRDLWKDPVAAARFLNLATNDDEN